MHTDRPAGKSVAVCRGGVTPTCTVVDHRRTFVCCPFAAAVLMFVHASVATFVSAIKHTHSYIALVIPFVALPTITPYCSGAGGTPWECRHWWVQKFAWAVLFIVIVGTHSDDGRHAQ